MVEAVTNFKSLGRPLDQTDYDWPAVCQNVKRSWRVYGRLGNMLRRKGADSKAAVIFYLAVVEAVLLFGSESWVMLT